MYYNVRRIELYEKLRSVWTSVANLSRSLKLTWLNVEDAFVTSSAFESSLWLASSSHSTMFASSALVDFNASILTSVFSYRHLYCNGNELRLCSSEFSVVRYVRSKPTSAAKQPRAWHHGNLPSHEAPS